MLFNEPDNSHKCHFPLWDLDPHLTHGSLGLHESTIQSASRSVLPFAGLPNVNHR